VTDPDPDPDPDHVPTVRKIASNFLYRTVGAVEQLWRYPVSSLGGEPMSSLDVRLGGVQGDRDFVLVDSSSGEVAAPETTPRWRKCVLLTARTNSSDQVLVSSSNWEFEVQDPALDKALSEFMGFACGVRRVGYPTGDGRGARRFGTRYKVSPLHILTTRNLSNLQTEAPDSMINVRRFRPNLVVRSSEFEDDWIGKPLAAGTFSGVITEGTKRCGMTMIAQQGIDEDPNILRTIVRHHGRKFGVYSGVTCEGTVSLDDDVIVASSYSPN
jgi:uncharacterized protein YcbX